MPARLAEEPDPGSGILQPIVGTDFAGLEFFLKSRSDVSDLGAPRTRQFDTKRYLEDVTLGS